MASDILAAASDQSPLIAACSQTYVDCTGCLGTMYSLGQWLESDCFQAMVDMLWSECAGKWDRLVVPDTVLVWSFLHVRYRDTSSDTEQWVNTRPYGQNGSYHHLAFSYHTSAWDVLYCQLLFMAIFYFFCLFNSVKICTLTHVKKKKTFILCTNFNRFSCKLSWIRFSSSHIHLTKIF